MYIVQYSTVLGLELHDEWDSEFFSSGNQFEIDFDSQKCVLTARNVQDEQDYWYLNKLSN